MRWFTARDMANGGIEERDAVLDEIRPLIAARTSRPRRGRRWSRLDAPENQALFSFVSKMRQLIFVFAHGRIWQ